MTEISDLQKRKWAAEAWERGHRDLTIAFLERRHAFRGQETVVESWRAVFKLATDDAR